MAIVMGAGTTKGISPEEQANRRLLARNRKKHNHGSHSGPTKMDAEARRRIEENTARRLAAAKTLDALTLKLLSNLDVLEIATFMLDIYSNTEAKKVGNKLVQPMDAALIRAQKKFADLKPGRILFAHRAVRAELGHQLSLV